MTSEHLILIGASNLSISLSRALSLAAQTKSDLGRRLWVAHGPGRSYGLDCGVLWWQYRGHARSDLLRALEERLAAEPGPLRALVTDIGNDIMYRVPVEEILAWVESVLSRLATLARTPGSRVAVTSLPVESVERMPSWKYRLLRPLFFPGQVQGQEEVGERVRRVQAGLEELTARHGIALLPTRAEWYGFDHFHLRASRRREAFTSWLRALELDFDTSHRARLPLGLRFYRPSFFRRFGRVLERELSEHVLPSGAVLRLY